MRIFVVSTLVVLLGWLAAPSVGLTQTHSHDGITPCALNHAQEQLFLRRPETRELARLADERLERETQQGEVAGNRDELLIIPIVFHVIHNYGPENISTAQVLDAVDVLNTNLRALNANIDEVIPEFEGIIADCEIEFRLAQRDPNGNCHPGINRIVSDLTYVGDSEMKSLIQWPRNMYLNVWVCENAAGAAGYALYPGSVDNWQNADMDGIVLQHSYCGSIGTSNPYRSRTLTHEVGHWLNLRHVWGNSNNPGLPENCEEDDNVSDTPNTLGWTNCNLDGYTCGSLDNVQNYMDYSYCGRMFSEGQKTRMRAAALSNTAQRNQLSTTSNLNATGVLEQAILCSAEFSQDRDIICVGDSIRFTDASYHGVSEWTWNFGDGSVVSGTTYEEAGELYHIFESPGLFDVQLTVGNGVDEVSTTLTEAVYVMAPSAMALPLQQGFEDAEYPAEDWFVEDPLGDGSWFVTSSASHSGDNSLKINNWSNDMEFNDDFLRTSTMDMSEMNEIHISYKWAYAHKGWSEDDETDDRLRISVTGDCGADWDLRRMHRGFTDLPSAPPTQYQFAPSGPEEWNGYTIVLDNEQYLTDLFRVQFEFESRLGNNIFLDDINIVGYGADDVVEYNWSRDWNLYPNPTQGQSEVAFTLPNAGSVRCVISDASGRMLSEELTQGHEGMNQMTLRSPEAAGVYLVSLETEEGLRKNWHWVVQ